MKIETKYNTDDKVWFYIEEMNRYAWGKIVSMEIRVRCGKVDVIIYNIENRFYDKDLDYHRVYHRDFRTDAYISLREKEVFEDVEKLKKHLSKLHKEKMADLSELKKRRWAILK